MYDIRTYTTVEFRLTFGLVILLYCACSSYLYVDTFCTCILHTNPSKLNRFGTTCGQCTRTRSATEYSNSPRSSSYTKLRRDRLSIPGRHLVERRQHDSSKNSAIRSPQRLLSAHTLCTNLQLGHLHLPSLQRNWQSRKLDCDRPRSRTVSQFRS